jgi:hypothetical protein
MFIQGTRLTLIATSLVAALLLHPANIHASGNPRLVSAVAVDPTDPLTVYAAAGAGLYKTTDGGQQWMLVTSALQGAHTLLIDPTMPSTLFARAGPRDILRSIDAGSTWASIGVSYWWDPKIAIDSQTGTLYAVHEYAVLTWDPNQEQWTTIFPFQWLPGEYAWIYSIAVQSGFVYVGVFYGGWETSATAVYSNVNGWWSGTELNTFPPTQPIPVDAMALDSSDPRIAYASVAMDGLFQTTDGGLTWSRNSNLEIGVQHIIRDPNCPNTMYAVYTTNAAKSDDGGLTWTWAHTRLAEILLALGVSPGLTAFAIDPHTPDTMYGGTEIGLFKTSDAGGHWAPTGLVQQSPLASLSIAPTSVIRGDAAIATVTLSVAQAGDVSIALNSSDVALATVPPSVTVPAGSTSATFAVVTTPGFTSRIVEIGAVLGDGGRHASLLLYAQTSVRSVYVYEWVVGPNPAAGTVQLTRAPGSTEPVEVTLASSNPAVASVPSSVTVPADATSAAFTIITTAVDTATPVTISATYGTTASAVITVKAPPSMLASLTVNPLSVTAGASATVTVTLTSGAPAGGASILLSSVQQPAEFASLPSSVTIPQDATSATFIVSTFTCKAGTATIAATYAGTVKSASLSATTTADAVAIERALYRAGRRTLTVDATSTHGSATLDVYTWSDGQVGSWIGRLTNLGAGSYYGQFSWSIYPPAIAVSSSSCGSATATVTNRK